METSESHGAGLTHVVRKTIIIIRGNAPGKAGVTSNTISLGLLNAISRNERVLLMENHPNINNIGNSAISPELSLSYSRKWKYFAENGLSCMLSKFNQTSRLSQPIVKNSCIEIYEDKLFYLPMGGNNYELLEYRLKGLANTLLNELEDYFSNIYIDLSSTNLESSRIILQRADMVVVNLYQNNLAISQFIKNFSEIQKKSFILIGKYDDRSKFTKEYIKKKYSIDSNRIGVVPYNARFMDAYSEGELRDFLLNINENTKFYRNIKASAEAVWKYANSVELKLSGMEEYDNSEEMDIGIGINSYNGFFPTAAQLAY
ncbi:MAG: hypothetical protein K6G63_03060 [Eubacterium sp.]|nr:hypothetical protein [Eubacterium sp.]